MTDQTRRAQERVRREACKTRRREAKRCWPGAAAESRASGIADGLDQLMAWLGGRNQGKCYPTIMVSETGYSFAKTEAQLRRC